MSYCSTSEAIRDMGGGTPSVALSTYIIFFDEAELSDARATGEEADAERALRASGKARFIPTTEWNTLPLSTKQELVAQRLEAAGMANARDVVREPAPMWFLDNYRPSEPTKIW